MKEGFGLHIEVHDKKLKKLLDDPDKLIKKIGLEMARMVKKRLEQLKASSNFKVYLGYGLGKPHALNGDLDKLYGIHLNKNYRLIVEPLVDLIDDESLKGCKEIDIKGVVDYHDGKIEWLIP